VGDGPRSPPPPPPAGDGGRAGDGGCAGDVGERRGVAGS